MSSKLINNCHTCGHKIPEGEVFCDSLCEQEYNESRCIKCGEIKEKMHTLKDPFELLGKKICYECHIEHEKKIKEK